MEAENALSLVQFWLTAESFHNHTAHVTHHPPPTTTTTTTNDLHQQQEQSIIESSIEDAVAIYDR